MAIWGHALICKIASTGVRLAIKLNTLQAD